MLITSGNILSCNCKYIVHQLNAISKKPAGLAKNIFTLYPYADVYAERVMPSTLGTVLVSGDGKEQRYILGIVAQYYPGKPYEATKSNIAYDSYEMREKYFWSGLEMISKIPSIESIAFPYEIGCGLAGGKWANYETMISKFADKIRTQQKAETFIYKL